MSLTQQRDAIATTISNIQGVPCYKAAPSGPLPTVFTIIGMPSWEQATEAVCMPYWTWPVLVCIGRSGTNDTLMVERLEEVWPTVMAALLSAINTDQTLGGVCLSANIPRAEFGTIEIQGKQLPCQTISLEIYGA